MRKFLVIAVIAIAAFTTLAATKAKRGAPMFSVKCTSCTNIVTFIAVVTTNEWKTDLAKGIRSAQLTVTGKCPVCLNQIEAKAERVFPIQPIAVEIKAAE